MPMGNVHEDLAHYSALMNTQLPLWGGRWRVEELLEPLQKMDTTGLAAKMQKRLAQAAAAKGQHRHQQYSSQRLKRHAAQLPRLIQESVSGAAAEEVPDKMIVVARADEDVSYLSLYLPDVPHTVYQAGWTPDKLASWVGPEPAFKAAPQAKETNVYLQYIVSHYDRLPETIVFIHAHRQSWHMDDVIPILRRLRWGEVGFSNLRHAGFEAWECGPPWEAMFPCGWEGAVLTPRQPFSPVFWLQPQAATAAHVSNNLKIWWKQFFEEELGPLPELVYTQCCAEFVVSRDRILAHPKSFYKRALDLVNETREEDYHELALAFEYAWHMVFGEPPVLAPTPECELLTCEDAASGGSSAAARQR